MKSRRVAIAGFGIAGGALATLLARAGHRVTVFERAPQPGPVGAGFLLHTSGQSVLRELGLLAEVEAHSARLEGLEAWTHRGRRLTDLKVGRALPGACARGVHRGVIFEVLYRAALEAGVEICAGVEIAGIRETAQAIHPVDVDGREHGGFDLLAACDGGRSRLRALINPECAGTRPAQWGALWGTGPCRAVSGVVYQKAHGARRLAGLLPVGGGRATFFWGLHADHHAVVMEKGFAAFVGEVCTLIPEAEEPLRSLGGFESMTWAAWQHVLPRRLACGRLVLLGDAAHTMSPQLGQGANLALLDAAALARNIDDFPAYIRERRGSGRFYGHLSALLSPFFQSLNPLAGPLRDLGLPVLSRIPWCRRQMELTFAGVKSGWFQHLTGSPRFPAPKPLPAVK